MLEIFQQFPDFFFFPNSLTTSSPSIVGYFGAQSLKQKESTGKIENETSISIPHGPFTC